MINQTRRNYNKVLNSISSSVLNAEYAVRGAIPIRGAELQK